MFQVFVRPTLLELQARLVEHYSKDLKRLLKTLGPVQTFQICFIEYGSCIIISQILQLIYLKTSQFKCPCLQLLNSVFFDPFMSHKTIFAFFLSFLIEVTRLEMNKWHRHKSPTYFSSVQFEYWMFHFNNITQVSIISLAKYLVLGSCVFQVWQKSA